MTTHDLRCSFPGCQWKQFGVQGDDYARELWLGHERHYFDHWVEVAE